MSDYLDALIAEAAAEVRAAKARPKSLQPIAPDPTASFIPSRQVAMFYRTHCLHCDTITLEFEGLFEERRHARLADTHLVRQPFVPLDDGLPRVRKYLPRDVPYCGECVNLDSYKEE